MSKKKSDKTEQREPAKHARRPGRAPLLVEVTVGLAQVALIVGGGLVFWLSLQAGVDYALAAVRAGVMVLAVGLLFWVVIWLLARSSLQAMLAQMQEAAGGQPRNTLDLHV